MSRSVRVPANALACRSDSSAAIWLILCTTRTDGEGRDVKGRDVKFWSRNRLSNIEEEERGCMYGSRYSAVHYLQLDLSDHRHQQPFWGVHSYA
jgi:hypothetical protein